MQRNVVDWDADSMLWSQRLSMRPVVLLHLLQMPHLKQNYLLRISFPTLINREFTLMKLNFAS